jgi:hypothetical protein
VKRAALPKETPRRVPVSQVPVMRVLPLRQVAVMKVPLLTASLAKVAMRKVPVTWATVMQAELRLQPFFPGARLLRDRCQELWTEPRRGPWPTE